MLSIDVALGAVCSALFFAHILQADVTYYSVACLGLSVWIIYTADHLLDAKKIKTSATTNRHRFHQQHFRLLIIIVSIAIAINIVLLFFIRKPALLTGIVLIVLVAMYLLIQHSLKILKEMFVAIVYTTGVMLPAMSNTTMALKEWNWIVIAEFFLVAFLNLIIFSWFDYENDLKDDRVSFATILGKKISNVFINFLFVLSAALWVVTYSAQPSAFIVLSMNVVLFIMVFSHSYFAKNDRYRILGDAIFFIPVLVYLFF